MGSFETFTIPCFVASGSCVKKHSNLNFDPRNTLYLKVHCPSIRPELVVISDRGRFITDFGQVSVGLSHSRAITIQNISNERVNLIGSLVDTSGSIETSFQ